MTTLDLRSPYTKAEWDAITAALGSERERRQKRGLPFGHREQMGVVDQALRPLREVVQLGLEVGE